MSVCRAHHYEPHSGCRAARAQHTYAMSDHAETARYQGRCRPHNGQGRYQSTHPGARTTGHASPRTGPALKPPRLLARHDARADALDAGSGGRQTVIDLAMRRESGAPRGKTTTEGAL